MTYYGKKKSFTLGNTFAAAFMDDDNANKAVGKFSIIATQDNLFVAKRNDGVLFKGFHNEMGYFMMGNDKA